MIVTVDTGGTKTLVTSFGRDGKMGALIRFPTPAKQSEYVRTLREILTESFGTKAVDLIVIALPGIIKDGMAVWCNNLGWKNFDAQEAFSGVLGKTPVVIENDANLAGLAETRALDPMPLSSLYVTVSTGIGTGVITAGRIDPGLRYSEGGRTIVEFDGEMREWETFASGKAIHQAYGKYASEITSEHTWQEIADRISRGFLAVIPIIQPDIIIIGGSIGTYFNEYSDHLRMILQKRLPAHIPAPRLVKAKHPEHAVIYGCYYYAIDYLSGR